MNIGFIANDSKKELMQNFCIAYKGILSKHELFATGTTGLLIHDVTNLDVHRFHPGHLGGVNQMAAQIELGQIDAMIFFKDPAGARSTSQDDLQIFVLCDLHNIPIATNVASAELLVMAIDKGFLDWRDLYKN